MKIGFPVNEHCRGGVGAWVKTFSNYCLSKGYQVVYNGKGDIDVFFSITNLSDLNELKELKKKGVTIIHRQGGICLDYFYDNIRYVKLVNDRIKECMRYADRFVYQSAFSKRLTQLLYDDTEIPGDIIYNAADPKVFSPVGDILDKPKDKKIILAAAYWGTQRMAEFSIRTIISTARRLIHVKDIEFWILGVANPQVESLLKDAGMPNITKVALQKPIAYEGMPKYLRTVDLILHVRPNDACSNMIIEAMHIGKPIVGFDIGSTPELIGNAGLLSKCEQSYSEFPKVDIEDMANNIIETFNNYEEYKKRIKQRAQLFTVETMGERYLQLAKEVCSEK
jgi:glycosyltransferase involved in cell wall biosynthesis